jgi:hypothetical protein
LKEGKLSPSTLFQLEHKFTNSGLINLILGDSHYL